MADGDSTLNAPPSPDDSSISVSPIVPDQHQQTPSAASPPPAAQQKQDEDPSKNLARLYNRLADSYNQQKKDDARYLAQSQSSWAEFQKKIAEIGSTPQPKLQQMPPAPTQKDQRNWGTTIGDVLSMVAIASTIFGKHRGGWSQAIQMSAVGAFVNGYTQGKENVAKNALEQWKEQTAMIQKNNEQQIQNYKDTLSDKRLTLQEQMDVLKAQSESIRDYRMLKASETSNLGEIVKTLHDQTQANLAYRKAQMDATNHFRAEFFKMPNAAAWRTEMIKRYGIDPLESEEKEVEAMKKYPLDQFNKDFKGGTVEEHEDDILGLKSDKKPTEEEGNQILSNIGLN